MNALPPPSRSDTIEAILAASQRPTQTVPIRWSLMQDRTGGGSKPGPLAALIGRGRDSTIEQYLLAHALASGEGYAVRLASAVWTRALGLSDDAAGRRTVGRNWRILSELGLVSTCRAGREIQATILDESGNRTPYRHPGEAPAQHYLQLPFAYWREGFHTRLSVPGKAVLMIAMTLGDWFSLPTRRGPAWYGLSRSTFERGFASARQHQVLEVRTLPKLAPLSPTGWTEENFYRLMPPFGPVGKVAKSAHEIFLTTADGPSPSPQRDSPTSPGKRRTPAAGTPAGGKAWKAGARRTSRSRRPTTPV